MVYKSLTEAPHNLKEAVDWLIALKGADAEKNLAAMGAAVHKFLADKPVGSMNVPGLEEVKLITKEFLKNPALKEMWPTQSVLRRFNEVINKEPGTLSRWFGDVYDSDYKNVIQTKGLTPVTIAKKLSKAVDGCEKFLEDVKHPEQYESAYSSEATWEKSCSEKPEACAVVLVGIAPMFYAGLRSLKVACKVAQLAPKLRVYVPSSSVGSLLLASGYQEKQWPTAMTPSYVATALKDITYQVLVTFYDLAGFWAFYWVGNHE
ncbi:hypothetical protein BBBOND_0208770 [Babesia bigemina]|uniref:Uncharacterized protein n=1 Tax=Babesia bigemina TaxID=5866 RepID=A0A061D583_BABBI|nr:hypothetical protein BBBOND_0208770 [Babesia bigemina]CDR95723.1 hypothetical protein BBBOND_0208770 [Babesia bigemina]|eukprot:XP_012767909.1 hypothetical protein BBBOND_0208770 [Babesia bigemina]